jgi:hypothetical protein
MGREEWNVCRKTKTGKLVDTGHMINMLYCTDRLTPMDLVYSVTKPEYWIQ